MDNASFDSCEAVVRKRIRIVRTPYIRCCTFLYGGGSPVRDALLLGGTERVVWRHSGGSLSAGSARRAPKCPVTEGESVNYLGIRN
jgi:hypothetical protein